MKLNGKSWLSLGSIFLGLIIGLAISQIWFARSPGLTAIQSEQDTNAGRPANDPAEKSIVVLNEEQIRDFGIEIEQAGPAELIMHRVLSGEVILDPNRVAYITPRVSGIVVRINKTLGDGVGKGEVMAVIDSRELADAKAAYLAAVERLSLTQASFDREKKLWEKKISSEEDYFNARQALAEAGIALRNAKQALYSLGFDQNYLAKLLDLPDILYTRYEILAPFKGIVIGRQVGLGEVVTDESQIYRIADLSRVWAELTIYQNDLGVIRVGQLVTIRADDIDAAVTGNIEYISPVIDESTRTATARVVISNPDRTWRPGTFVTGQVDAGTSDVPVAVVRGAITKLSGRDVVFIQTDEGFEPKAVRVGRTDPTSAEILSGIEPGQCYVCANAFILKAELSKSTFAGNDDD